MSKQKTVQNLGTRAQQRILVDAFYSLDNGESMFPVREVKSGLTKLRGNQKQDRALIGALMSAQVAYDAMKEGLNLIKSFLTCAECNEYEYHDGVEYFEDRKLCTDCVVNIKDERQELLNDRYWIQSIEFSDEDVNSYEVKIKATMGAKRWMRNFAATFNIPNSPERVDKRTWVFLVESRKVSATALRRRKEREDMPEQPKRKFAGKGRAGGR